MILPTPTPKTVLLAIGAVIFIMAASYIAALAVAFVQMIP
jgi:hypothetical protein